MLNFNDFINEKNIEDDDISIKIDNSNPEFVSYLIDKFTYIITKRSVKNLRPIKINGLIVNDKIDINITMTNKDIIKGVYESENLMISINSEIIYDVDKKDLNENKFVDKLSEEYVKYLKNKNYKVKL
jgi:hypothetical protein